MKVIIVGSSGMVGNLVYENCIRSKEISEIILLSRKESHRSQNDKVKEIIVKDFSDYSEHSDSFKNVDSAFFCLGAYTGAFPDDQFKIITVDYAVNFAKMLEAESPNAKICLLSGMGADRSEKSRTSFARYKGMAENQISATNLEFYAFRPGYIYPVTPRKEPNIAYKISRFLYPVIKYLGGNVKSTELADAMFMVGNKGHTEEIIENKDILKVLN